MHNVGSFIHLIGSILSWNNFCELFREIKLFFPFTCNSGNKLTQEISVFHIYFFVRPSKPSFLVALINFVCIFL